MSEFGGPTTGTSTGGLNRRRRIFIVDDHSLVRRGLEHLINDQPDLEICGEAATLAEARSKIPAARPDLAVIDLSLQDGSGLELIKDIKANWPDVKVLVASMHSEELYGERALRAGALGFITKQEPAERVIEAIRRILGHEVFVSAKTMNEVLHHAAHAGISNPSRPSIESLSDRELEVFEMLGRGESSRHIAEKLHLSVKTIHTYREHIKTKLRLKDAAELRCHAAQWFLESRGRGAER